ncbi:MAG: SRPBCC family protein [Methylophilaceae bacterium]|nr:SRPBCC family protein [Methylophilaceae bacterium]
MKKFLALIAMAVFSASAVAHGPTPQKVDDRIVIKAEPAKVWAMVKDFGKAEAWMPNVASTTTEKKGAETLRTLTLKSGGKLVERVKNVDDADMKIKFEFVSGGPIANYSPYISVSPGPNAGESSVRYFHRFYRFYPNNPPIPEGQDDASAVKFVKDNYTPALENLKKVIENLK